MDGGAGGLQSMGSWRVGHDWVTSLSLFTFMHRRRKWQPTPVFLPGESQGRGARWAAISGVAQSRTRLKWLSSSNSSSCWESLLTHIQRCTWVSRQGNELQEDWLEGSSWKIPSHLGAKKTSVIFCENSEKNHLENFQNHSHLKATVCSRLVLKPV